MATIVVFREHISGVVCANRQMGCDSGIAMTTARQIGERLFTDGSTRSVYEDDCG